jgi:hypothetical protein
MKRSMPGVAKITGALALAGGMVMMAALPAAAAAPNEAYAASATGLISASPIGLASYPTGTSPVTLGNANIAGLLTTGIVTDTAGSTSASSTVADPSARLTRVSTLSATTVASSCSFNTTTGTVSGTSSITDGAVRVLGLPARTLASNPAPNTTVSVPGIATITLNRQTTASDGTLTVSAIYVSLLHRAQTLTLATSVCNKAKLVPVPILPGKSLPLSLAGLTVLLIGGVGYRVTRRSRLAAAA